ncbi:uncharacterized protein ATNIH1004_003133 [Aspergillus tanneri]|uniref:Uncharacterized protein n=1 Tax=Aspergillus tanneri TaxID=1220188 RepID=A0A5M9N779_9EURO|nr:uncharacterized protein ATNIH1004_003133 [Aspergillus tanneri]KAA8650447.1 hypothetical protein ATNIH1004_003133 [Aspergillus tanneri]
MEAISKQFQSHPPHGQGTNVGLLLFSQATKMIDPGLNNGLPTNLVAHSPSLSFTMKRVHINIVPYVAELAYLANLVRSYVQPAEMHNQSINSMAFISSRYTMQAMEIVFLICRGSTRLAPDISENLRPQIQTSTSEIFSPYLSDPELSKRPGLQQPDLTSQNESTPSSKTHYPVWNTISNRSRGPIFPAIERYEYLNIMYLSSTAYKDIPEPFTKLQHTGELLGTGSKILYQAVQHELGALHVGFVEHPNSRRRIFKLMSKEDNRAIGCNHLRSDSRRSTIESLAAFATDTSSAEYPAVRKAVDVNGFMNGLDYMWKYLICLVGF